MKKRILSWLLVVVMLLGMLPMTAIAEDHAGQVRVIVENATYAKAKGAEWDGVLVDKWVDLTSSSTVLTCVVDALGTYSQTGAEAGYISEINGLKAFDGGEKSGWMGTLNDFFTNAGLGSYTTANGKLSAGDEIHMQYTCAWGADLGNDWSSSDRTLKSLTADKDTLSPAFDKNTHAYTLTVPAGTVHLTAEAANKRFQVRIGVDGKEYKRTAGLPVKEGSVITVTCGDENWDAMSASKATVETYTITVTEKKNSASVTIRSQMAGGYLHGLKTETVSAKLAETYGYTDKVDGVSALDALVRAHELTFGEAFTKETAKDYLEVGSTGWISKIFGKSTYASGFYLNEGYPNDGTPSAHGPGYNGTFVTTQEIRDGDVLDFYIMGDDTDYSDYYTWLDAPVGAGAGQSFDVTVKGFYAMEGYRYKTPEDLKKAAELLEGVQLVWVDAETGETTAIAGAVTAADEDDEDDYYYATVKAPEKQGTYYLAATGNEENDLYCLMNPVAFEVVGAPESITVKYVGSRELNGQLVGKKGDTFQLKAYDQNGKETPVAWSTSSGFGTLDKNGLLTLTTDTGVGSTSYFYYTVTSLADSSVKYEGKLEIIGYEIGTYNRNKTVTLSADGQTAKTDSISGGVKDHTIWSYEIPEGVAALTQEPGKGTQISFNFYRPGKVRVQLVLDIDETMTSAAEITVKGLAVEDAAGKQGKTYVELSKEQPHPTAQLTAYCEEGRSVASWESANPDVVTVDETGKLTAQAVGSSLITVTDDNGTKGGIKVVVTDAETPYFEAMEFMANPLSTWKAGETFQPTKLEYDLTIKAYTTSSLILQAGTIYDTEKYTATAEYTDVNGEKQTVTVNSGKMTTLPDQPFDGSVMTITLADKKDPEKKTVYTFNVTRPRDTSKAIKTTTGLVLVPDGRALEATKYENYAEGTVFRLDADGNYVMSGSNRTTGTAANHYSYRVFLFENEKSFSLTFAASTAYQHLRYSADGEGWTELPQGGGMTEKLGFSWGKATVKLQLLDDKTYTDNVKAGKDGFAEGEPAEYTVEVVQLDVSASDAQLLTAKTEQGDWYPEFSPAQYSYNIVVPNGTTEGTLTYTVSEGATVKLGSTVQTPDENGVYTLTLKTSAQTLTLTAENGLKNSYSIKLLAKSKYAGPDKVVDYLCIGSQYTNGAGYGGFGIGPETTLAGSLKSLGNFGGYITYYFENAITDNPNNKYGIDFYVYGNSSEMSQDSMAELGQVYVSEDGKTWFALAGSEHYEDKAIWDYTVTYTKRADGMSEWTDNQGNSMIAAAAVAWPKQSLYYMNDVGSRDSYTFTGVLFKSQEDGTVMGTSQTSSFAARAKFGYADYYANGTIGADVNPYVEKPTQSNGFDLAWAVDANGSPVKLTDVHYVKVATASNIWAGMFKEKSTEVMQLVLTAAQDEAVGKTAQPTGVTLANGSYEKTVELTEQVCHVSADGMSELALSVNGTADDDNIYINNTRVASGKSVTVSVPETGERLVRVLVQNGDKEPVVYLLKIERGQSQEEKTLASIRDIYEQTGATLNATAQANAPQVGSVGGEWLVLGLARSGFATNEEYYQNVVKYVQEHINEKGQLSPRVSTDNSRLILALSAAGYDVTDVGGHNLLRGLSDLNYIKKQGINGPIFALLALDCRDYDLPKNADSTKQITREALLDCILSAQLDNGGWSLDGDADADLTAMALQALAPYQSDERVAAATQKAIELLSAMQEENGGFTSWGSNNSNTAAQVVIALSALNIDAFKDERFQKEGVSVLEAMCEFYTGKGSFGYADAQTADQMSTEQCYLALAAYFRMLDGKKALYNMTDVELSGHVHAFLREHDENGHWTACSCGEKTEVKPHTYGAWTVTKQATDKAAGARERTCTVCGYVQQEEIPVNPKTGDGMELTLWLTLGGASMLALAVLMLLKKRQKA